MMKRKRLLDHRIALRFSGHCLHLLDFILWPEGLKSELFDPAPNFWLKWIRKFFSYKTSKFFFFFSWVFLADFLNPRLDLGKFGFEIDGVSMVKEHKKDTHLRICLWLPYGASMVNCCMSIYFRICLYLNQALAKERWDWCTSQKLVENENERKVTQIL